MVWLHGSVRVSVVAKGSAEWPSYVILFCESGDWCLEAFSGRDLQAVLGLPGGWPGLPLAAAPG